MIDPDELKNIAAKLESGDYLLVPKIPNQDCLNSMAMRYRHDFGLLDDNFRQSITTEMRQLYEEATGQGFYSHEVEKKAAKSTQYEDLSQILSHKIQEQD